MSNKKIIAVIMAFVLSAGIFAGVNILLDDNYNEYTAKGTENTDTENIISENETEKVNETQVNQATVVKQAVQNITYQSELFGDNMINIDIITDEDNWQNMIDNASDEEYISVDVNVNGTLIENVGIRPKGNSSLATVKDSDSDKYSFKLKFDKYVDEQTCFGLDKLVLNNIISDNTYMKDYIAFDMMNYMGVNSSLYNYSYITVNGEYWGLYIALEAYDKSFLNRTYGDDSGFLYNVKSMDIKGDRKDGMMPPDELFSEEDGDFKKPEDFNPEDFNPEDFNTEDFNPEDFNPEDFNPEDFNPEDFNPENFGKMNIKDKGGSLIYTDDNWQSYSSIFENAVFNRTSEEDYKRVITALEKLSKGENIDEYFDVDQILRYLAVHTALVNLDSYSSNMAQNYYIYEKDGKLSILPWDYNLSFGGFSPENSTSAINFPIDTPVSDVKLEERPLIAKILEIDEYKQKYHEYLQKLVDEYFNSGYFTNKVDEINSKIDNYVETEPQPFCTYDDYKSAVDTLKTFCELRAESIEGQLNGSIPSTSEEQQENSQCLITDENINLSDMGGQRNPNNDRHNKNMPPENITPENDNISSEIISPENNNMPPKNINPESDSIPSENIIDEDSDFPPKEMYDKNYDNFNRNELQPDNPPDNIPKTPYDNPYHNDMDNYQENNIPYDRKNENIPHYDFYQFPEMKNNMEDS